MRQFLKGDISQSIMEAKVLSLAQKIWELVPDSIREVETSIFKNKIKTWSTDKCPSQLCKII